MNILSKMIARFAICFVNRSMQDRDPHVVARYTHAGCVFKCQGGMPGGPGFHAEQGVHLDTPSGQQQR